MTILEQQSSEPSRKLPKWLGWGMIAVSFLGFLDASYLTATHYLGNEIACSILKGCETVTTSSYATWGPIPVALLGAIYYLTVLVLLIAHWDTGRQFPAKLAAYLTVGGFLFSLWFVYLQIWVIGAICIYCMASAISSSLLFIGGMSALAYFRPGRSVIS
ncbi:vitamin K epoxide reductase family protein [Candidatus Uhrbacteria bacterium]|nr:vitamin K epoxide reductase family protein [Candidatus Uhrbacteria bacterium]